MFELNKELEDIGTRVFQFEERLLAHVNKEIEKSLKDNEDISVVVKDGYVVLSDYIDGEQVDYLIYFSNDDVPVVIEVTKQGTSLGYLDSESEAYTKYVSIIKPLDDVYRTYFEWDGVDFLKKFI